MSTEQQLLGTLIRDGSPFFMCASMFILIDQAGGGGGPRAHLHDQRVGDGLVLGLARPQITASKRSFSALFVPFQRPLRARTVGSGEGEDASV